MPVDFRLDLHRRLWIQLSNPYWYEKCIPAALAIKAKAHGSLIKHDVHFKHLPLFADVANYSCICTDSCLNCPTKNICRLDEGSNILSEYDKWYGTVFEIGEAGKRRNLKLKLIYRACLLAQNIAFCKLEECAFDEDLYTLIDDMSTDFETTRKMHYT